MFLHVFIKVKKHIFTFFYLQINVFNIYAANFEFETWKTVVQIKKNLQM